MIRRNAHVIDIAPRCSLLALLPLAARAEPVQASYDAYAAGLNVIKMEPRFDVGADAYRVRLDYRTAGAFSLVFRGRAGHHRRGRASPAAASMPQRFFSARHAARAAAA